MSSSGIVRRLWRSMHMSGTTPEPPPTSTTGDSPLHTKYDVNGPRSSTSSPTSTTSWK